MSRQRTLALVLLFAAVAGAYTLLRGDGDKPAPPAPVAKPAPAKPEPAPKPGTPIDPATAEAWAKAGFELGYRSLRMDENLPELKHDRAGVGDAELATVPPVRVPFTLYLGRREFTDAGLAHLARHPHLVGLDLSSSGVTDAGLGQLADLKSLRSLDLTFTAVTTAALLKSLPQFEHLTTLRLDKKHLTDPILAALAEHGLLRLLVQRSRNPLNESFVTLDLSDAPVTDESLKHVATVADLTHLHLQGTGVRGDGLKHLRPLRKLVNLGVSRKGKAEDGGGFTDEMLGGLVAADLLHAGHYGDLPMTASGASSKRPTRVEEVTALTLNYTQVTDEGLKHLAGLTNLRDLELAETRVTGTGFRHLTGLKNLTALDLRNCQTTEEGLAAVAGVENLGTLELWGQAVTAGGVKHLAGLKKLRKLYLSTEVVTDEVLAALVDTGLLRALTGMGRDRRPHWGVRSYMHPEGAFPARLDDVTYLNLIDTRVTDDGLKPLAKLKNLLYLKFGAHAEHRHEAVSTVTGAGLKHLTHLPLAHLVLEGPYITDESMAHVAGLKRLESLDIHWFTAVTPGGFKRLAPLKDTLTELDFHTWGSSPTEEFKAELGKVLPKCKITNLVAGPGQGDER